MDNGQYQLQRCHVASLGNSVSTSHNHIAFADVASVLQDNLRCMMMNR
jgi:hypothetical protein